MDNLILPHDIYEKIISHCKSVYPKEACGILAGKNDVIERVYEMTNIENSTVSYLMEPKEQFRVMKEMRNHGEKMIAIYHSHPHSSAYPSNKDVNLASYPDSAYIIVSLADKEKPEIRAFEINEGRRVTDVELEISGAG
jgi:[CysO sulfur-carrier protein]-S-L-cysteine hydrolase